MVSVMRRVAAISAGPRSASPRGRRARSFWGFLGFSAMGGVGTSAGAMRQPRLLLPLPLLRGRVRDERSSLGGGEKPQAPALRRPHPGPPPQALSHAHIFLSAVGPYEKRESYQHSVRDRSRGASKTNGHLSPCF